jgi:DNA-binding transcriptional ArsR family regulator
MPRRPPKSSATDPAVDVIAHPLRIEILRHSLEPVSAKELAAALGEPVTTVSYHSRMLLEAGLLETVRVQRVRGFVKKFNRCSVSAKPELRRLADEFGGLADAL